MDHSTVSLLRRLGRNQRFHIYKKVNKFDSASRSDFLLDLYKQLIGPHLSRRRQLGYSGVHTEEQQAIEKVFLIIYQE